MLYLLTVSLLLLFFFIYTFIMLWSQREFWFFSFHITVLIYVLMSLGDTKPTQLINNLKLHFFKECSRSLSYITHCSLHTHLMLSAYTMSGLPMYPTMTPHPWLSSSHRCFATSGHQEISLKKCNFRLLSNWVGFVSPRLIKT